MSLGYCYILLLLAFVAVVSGVDEIVNKKVGDKALFKPDITAATSLKDSSITWKYAAGGDVIKVIEWDNDFKTLESLNPKFNKSKPIVNLDRSTGELTIRDLQLEHTGLYTIEINNKEQEKKFKLTVMEVVTQPKLKHEDTSNPDVKYLTCEYNETISWSCSEGKMPETKKLDNPRQGEFIQFDRAEMLGICCTCTLKNDVSEETSEPVCGENLFTVSSGTLSGVAILFIVLAVIFICIIPFILYLFCDPFRSFVKKHEKNRCLKGFIDCLERCRNTIRCLKTKKEGETEQQLNPPLEKVQDN